MKVTPRARLGGAPPALEDPGTVLGAAPAGAAQGIHTSRPFRLKGPAARLEIGAACGAAEVPSL